MLDDLFVTGNRWDLLGGPPSCAPEVSVIVVHYDQPAQLARTHLALSRQTVPPAEIVVADDGSPVEPVLPLDGPPTLVVSQPDLGFRAAAARNLAARRCRGEILVFLDADTTPEVDFIGHLTRRVTQCRDVVAVGRRRHADLAGLPLGADPSSAPELDEPAWLRQGYDSSRNLLDADGRSFRYVISAVLACRRSFFDEIGGFDERFVGYGGEDWDFGYRAWNAGGILVHEPDAVAWHDGPSWAERIGPDTTHDPQSMRLASLIPEPATRGAPLPLGLPDLLVDLVPGLDVPTTVRAVHSLLRQGFGDLRIRLASPVHPQVEELYGDQITTAAWGADQLRRARGRLMVRRPLPGHAVGDAMDLLTDADLGVVDIVTSGVSAATLTSTRALARAERWRDRPDLGGTVAGFGSTTLEVGVAPAAGNDLAGYFAAGPRSRRR